MSRAHLARINDWLWVGNCESCPTFKGYNVVHIFRTDKAVEGKPSQERFCTLANRKNLRMNYQDGDEIDPTNLKNLDAFVQHLKDQTIGSDRFFPHPTLVHCHAGMCRSPTVAMYILSMVEDIHPIDAQQLITKAIYEQRSQEVCNICRDPLKQILQLWEERKAKK